MGADILERLRKNAARFHPHATDLIREAAAEIVRLRGEVENITAEAIEWRDKLQASTPAPAMPNGVEGLVQNFLDKEVHPTVRHWENHNLAGISILKHWRDFLISLTHAADNRAPAAVPAGEAVAQTLRDALAYVGYRTDGDLSTLAERAELWMRESKVLIAMQQELAAHPSACELVVDDAMVERAALAISRRSLSNAGHPWPIELCRKDARVALEAALQHRGDSRGGEAA